MASNYDSPSMQRKLDAPMPLIGMYVALASLACSLTMAADLIHGFRSNKLWFPSKYFSLNATSLTLLSVALKLPIDLTTNMSAFTDRLAKISSLALMSTAMANFVPSLGSMSDGDILINVTALGILIVTVVADVCIQVVGTRSFLHHRVLFPEEILALILMLLLLLVLGSTAIMALTTKKCLEAKYQEKHNLATSQEFSDMGAAVVDKLRILVRRYWVMAETSSPQFVIARSAACAASGVICLANALVLTQAIVRTGVANRSLSLTGSSYGCSTKYILLTQTVGVIVGTISTSFRWCIAVRFRCPVADDRSLRNEFKVEDYWYRKLVEWQGTSISPKIRHHKLRRAIYKARRRAVEFMIRAQIFAVLFNKLLLVISCFITGAFIKVFQHLKKKMSNSVDSAARQVHRDEFLQNVRPNSLRLEGEADLPDYMLQSIPKHVDEVLETARRQKSSGLIEFLGNSTFKGVGEFDSYQVPSIHGKEPKNCWSLPLVTLTSIAVALPNVPTAKIDKLVSNVRDGLFFVKMVEKSFYKHEEWKNIRRAADFWLRVDLFRKWQEIDLANICSTSSNSKEAIQVLMKESMKIASDLKTDVPDCPMFNPSNWAPKIIAANSMYRITGTILDKYDEENLTIDDNELFDQLSGTIADILAACLTNLARVITKKCHFKAIDDRERSVRHAALLLGKTEEIIDFLVCRDLPAGLNPDYAAAYVEEWRRAMQLEIEMMSSVAVTPSCNETASSEAEGRSSCSITLLEHLHRSFQCSRDLELCM
ncbi:hypothetical protein C2S53_015505 [Perilla frutescens var. hirtella]|uniref:Uncharacterized protein n=1 Tax=Perilla frutescens var. hirtella TaxID=608512 RepID=A0AAD4IMJ2_PERFH|nr:hypothetical protein C2S53_015505 [Perilla frutescens var. hirtella]